MDLVKILPKDKAKEILEIMLQNGGEFAEIFMEKRTDVFIKTENKKIENVETGIDNGFALRLIADGVTYFVNGNFMDYENIKSLAHNISVGIKTEKKAEIKEFEERNIESPNKIEISPDTVELHKKIEIVRKADDKAWNYDSSIVQVMSGYKDAVQDVLIINNEGVYDTDKRVDTIFYTSVTARKGDIIQTGRESQGEKAGFEFYNGNKTEEIAEEASRLAVLQLEAEPAPAGTFTVVMSAEAGGTMVHEACGHGLEGDSVNKNLSVFAGKIGKKVANELITVIDDGTMPNKMGSHKIDDEGEPMKETVLIENGILKGYIHSRKTALESGAEKTGSGRRESYRHIPLPRMRNTYIKSGNTEPEEIIKSVDKGILVKKMGGGQVDVVTGNFMFAVMEGYMIENGKITSPIRGATLTGNGPEILEKVDMVGNDLGFAIGRCGKGGQGASVGDAQPTMRIPEIVVGGIVK